MQVITLTILVCLAAFAAAQGGGWGGDGHKHDDHHHTNYKFEYGVKDGHTKDHHEQWEHGHGDSVKGEYSLDEADGTKRVVEYHADHHGGFHPHVKRIGHADHPHGHSYANYNQFHH